MTVGDLPERLEANCECAHFAPNECPQCEAAARIRALEGENARLTEDRNGWKSAWNAMQELINLARKHGGEPLVIRCIDAEASLAKAIAERDAALQLSALTSSADEVSALAKAEAKRDEARRAAQFYKQGRNDALEDCANAEHLHKQAEASLAKAVEGLDSFLAAYRARYMTGKGVRQSAPMRSEVGELALTLASIRQEPKG